MSTYFLIYLALCFSFGVVLGFHWETVAVYLVLTAAFLYIASTTADAKPVVHHHCAHHRRHCVSISETFIPPGIANSFRTTTPLTDPIPLADYVFPNAPYAGSVWKLHQIAFLVPYSVGVDYIMTAAPPATPNDPTIAVVAQLYYDNKLIWQERQVIDMTFNTNSSATFYSYGTQGALGMNYQFNPDLVIRPSGTLEFKAIAYPYMQNPLPVASPASSYQGALLFGNFGRPFRQMDDMRLAASYDVATIDTDRSTNGPLY